MRSKPASVNTAFKARAGGRQILTASGWEPVSNAGTCAPDQLATRGSEGHLGLRALEGLFADAGGALTVRSAPGRGTLVEMRVPLP